MCDGVTATPTLPRKWGRENIALISRLPSPHAAGTGVGGEGK
jgi:hypothetical protein